MSDVFDPNPRYLTDYDRAVDQENEQREWEADDTRIVPRAGQNCPTCSRRMPHERKDSSPQSKKKAYWVAVDEHKAHEEILETAAKFLGTYERPFWEFQTVTVALALLLQDENMRGYANRGWVPPVDYPDLDAA